MYQYQKQDVVQRQGYKKMFQGSGSLKFLSYSEICQNQKPFH